MSRPLVLAFLVTTLPPRTSTSSWVRTCAPGDGSPALHADKDWASGEVKESTSHHALGRTRTSGTLRGYAFALQPGGAWAWNLGDGSTRLDYLPTASRQWKGP